MAYILALLLSLSSAAWAAPDTCSTVDLNQELPGFAAVPHWNQGNTHLCYAYTAAHLIDAYRFSHGDKDLTHITSPLLLAVQTVENFKDQGSSYRGGKIEHAFAAARQFGICNSKQIADRLGPFKADAVLENMTRLHRLASANSESKTRSAEKVLEFLLSAGFKSDELAPVGDIEKNLSLSFEDFMSRTLLAFCRDPKQLEYLPLQKTLFQPRVSLEAITVRLNGLLSQRTPVGINFCANVVTDPTHEGRMQGNEWYCREKLNHSALIAGRKMINGRCHYLVRDSGCDGYKKNPQLCQNGEYWIAADSLLKNTEGIFWLD